MGTDVRGHTVPLGTEAPASPQEAIRELGLTVNDVVMAGSATDRAQKLTDIGSSATRPLLVMQTDTWTLWLHDGSKWRYVWAAVPLTLDSQSTTTETGASNANLVYASASIVLPVDTTWEVQGGATLINTVTADAASVGLWNSTTSSEVASSRGASSTASTTAAVALESLPMVLAVTAATTIRVLCCRNGGSTIQAKSLASSPAAWLHAKRVA